jgi:hypothetical protein
VAVLFVAKATPTKGHPVGGPLAAKKHPRYTIQPQ